MTAPAASRQSVAVSRMLYSTGLGLRRDLGRVVARIGRAAEAMAGDLRRVLVVRARAGLDGARRLGGGGGRGGRVRRGAREAGELAREARAAGRARAPRRRARRRRRPRG